MTNALGKLRKNQLASTRTAPALVIPGDETPKPVREAPRPLSLKGFLRKSQQDRTIDWTRNDELRKHALSALSLVRFDRTQYHVAVRTLIWVVQSYHPATIEKAKELTTIIADWWIANHSQDAMGLAAISGVTTDLSFPLQGMAHEVAAPSQFRTVQETRSAVGGALNKIREDGATPDGRPLIVPG